MAIKNAISMVILTLILLFGMIIFDLTIEKDFTLLSYITIVFILPSISYALWIIFEFIKFDDNDDENVQ